jgi:hypothetical protein
VTALLTQGSESVEHPLDQFITLGARSVLQVAYEQEVTEWLGRAHYQRRARRDGGCGRSRIQSRRGSGANLGGLSEERKEGER